MSNNPFSILKLEKDVLEYILYRNKYNKYKEKYKNICYFLSKSENKNYRCANSDTEYYFRQLENNIPPPPYEEIVESNTSLNESIFNL